VGNVYFSNYVRWQGKVREQFLAEKAPAVLAELQSGLELVTLAVECRYLAQLFPFDHVLIRMTLEAIEPTSARLRFKYFRLAGGAEQLVATGSQEIGACKDFDGERKCVSLPEPLLTALREYS
jgi:enediyne biosynthesis thioesterase